MKKIISTLLFVVGLVSFSFSQEAHQIASTTGAEDLAISKTSGVYEYTLPSNITKEALTKSASYYKTNFTVDFDEASHKATITIPENTLRNRYVMARLLTACKVTHIAVDDKKLQLYDFIDSYLK
ncbi:MAG: hypothetical protein HRT57_07100 [Crocinitomicaceae bacterium]|nr:hypothetical protein [Crocinitomicaceae bacterium]